MVELDSLFKCSRFGAWRSYCQLVEVVKHLLEIDPPAGEVCFTKAVCISAGQACNANGGAVHRSVIFWRNKYWNSPELHTAVCAVCYGGEEDTRKPKPYEFARLMAEYVRKVRERATTVV